MPSLHVTLPDGSDATHELTDDVVSLGRVSDNAIQIDDVSVSSHHAELIQHGSEYILKDIGSTNGTQVNGQAVAADEETTLHHGDQIVFGSIPVRYLAHAEEAQSPLPQGSEPVLEAATSSVVPGDFSNASPFQKRSNRQSGASLAVLGVGVLAMLAALAALAMVFQMKSPL